MTQLSAIALGRGIIRVAESTVTNQAQNSSILSSSDNIGQAEECVLSNELDFATKRTVESISDVKKMLTKNNLFLDVTIMEASVENLRMLFTGDRASDTSFFVGGSVFDPIYRVEVVFVYPNKVDTMTLVIPKVKIVSTSDFSLVNLSEPNKPAFSFQSLPVDNNTWNNRLGRVIFS